MLFKVLQVQTKSTVAFLCLFFLSATFMVAQNCNSTLAHWNLDACSPGTSYDDYTAQTNFPANMTGSASTFSSMGHHSCTPGNSGSGICHSIHDDCTWDDNNPNAFRFSVDVAPAAGYKSTISGLNFFEAAPLNYTWLNGATGDNDPPSKYGVRVLKDGVEIFQQIEVATSPTWSLEEFDFSGNMEFMSDRAATYSFEILGYCRQANSPTGYAVWDIDEIMVIGCAQLIDPCASAGGDADGDGICANDDCDDNDPNVGSMANDMDCDGIPTAMDCDDNDPNVGSMANDMDCDGITTAMDCDDNDPNVGNDPNDMDCDGIPTAMDCDDNDPNVGSMANDMDCDGVTTANDCNDNDPNVSVPGNACNDGNPNTTNDVVTANCTCVGTPVNPNVDCPNLNANVGDACDDGNPNTSNDQVQANCTCVGTGNPPPPPPVTPGCDVVISVSGNTVTILGANDAMNSVKVIAMNGGILYEINSWTGTFPAAVTYTFPADGKYFVHVQTYTAGFASQVCDIFETIIIGTPPPPAGACSITASASNVRCDGAGTFSFDVTATSVNGGAWGFDVLGTTSMMNINGSTVTISGVPVGAGTTLTYMVIDHDKPSCTTTISVTPPSTPCRLLPPTDVCEAEINITGRDINVTGLTNEFVGVKVIDANFGTIFQCDTWDGNCDGTAVDVTLDQPGTYYVSVVTYDADWNSLCRLFEKVVISNEDGLTNPNTGINVFPNPAENNVNLRMNGFDSQDIDVMILSQFGRVVKTFKFDDVEDRSNIQLSLEGLNNGVYSIVVLSDDKAPISKKLVVGKSYNSSFLGH